jgi:hypothetical protein
VELMESAWGKGVSFRHAEASEPQQVLRHVDGAQADPRPGCSGRLDAIRGRSAFFRSPAVFSRVVMYRKRSFAAKAYCLLLLSASTCQNHPKAENGGYTKNRATDV